MDVDGTRVNEAIDIFLALGYAHTCGNNLPASIPDSSSRVHGRCWNWKDFTLETSLRGIWSCGCFWGCFMHTKVDRELVLAFHQSSML